MTPTARIINAITSDNLTEADAADFELRRKSIPGWSTLAHVAYFKAVLAELYLRRPFARVLVCGVYRGLDLAIIADLHKRNFGTLGLRLTGVDLFSSESCADWPEAKRGQTWEEAFGCAPPSLGKALENCPIAEIYKSDSVGFLRTRASEFDFIYLDTSHDFATVRAELAAIMETPRVAQLVGGDDYAEGNGGFDCGVAKAVETALPHHNALFNRVWLASL